MRGDGRQSERGEGHRVGAVGELDDVLGAGHGALGHAAVARCHPGRGGEPHRAALDGADALDAGHVRCRGPAEVGGAGGAEQVQRGDRGGEHLDEELSGPLHGRLPVGHDGRPAGLAQFRRPHVAMSG